MSSRTLGPDRAARRPGRGRPRSRGSSLVAPGGFLIVPTLAIGLAFTMRTAVGTSLVIITATSLLGFAAHLLAGRGVDAAPTLTMAVARVAGALAGASLAALIPQRILGRSFALLMVAVAGYLLVSAAFLGGPPGAA